MLKDLIHEVYKRIKKEAFIPSDKKRLTAELQKRGKFCDVNQTLWIYVSISVAIWLKFPTSITDIFMSTD